MTTIVLSCTVSSLICINPQLLFVSFIRIDNLCVPLLILEGRKANSRFVEDEFWVLLSEAIVLFPVMLTFVPSLVPGSLSIIYQVKRIKFKIALEMRNISP